MAWLSRAAFFDHRDEHAVYQLVEILLEGQVRPEGYGCGGDRDAEAIQFASDPLVAPARILACEAKHQLAHRCVPQPAVAAG